MAYREVNEEYDPDESVYDWYMRITRDVREEIDSQYDLHDPCKLEPVQNFYAQRMTCGCSMGTPPHLHVKPEPRDIYTYHLPNGTTVRSYSPIKPEQMTAYMQACTPVVKPTPKARSYKQFGPDLYHLGQNFHWHLTKTFGETLGTFMFAVILGSILMCLLAATGVIH